MRLSFLMPGRVFLNILLLRAVVAKLLSSLLLVRVNKQTAKIVPKAPQSLPPVAPTVAMAAGPLVAAAAAVENQYLLVASSASLTLWTSDSEPFDALSSDFF